MEKKVEDEKWGKVLSPHFMEKDKRKKTKSKVTGIKCHDRSKGKLS